ncbi:LacI family DNA-binding transcriptional regulator [Tessaracoccus flavus]|nr:LacI family DNA-binding transcriptional regulator [Tessaracoccus flavus]SDY78733.1 transcriptional regulator, LacI family [Tessaracoccus flavus]
MIRPTLEDVARYAGVSRATVSRVVRRDPNVASETVTKVDAAVAELGYVPNGAARSLATGRSNTLAMVVPEPDTRVFSDPFFGLAVAGINAGLAGTDMQLVMVFASRTDRAGAVVDFLLEGRVAGAIIVSHHRSDGLVAASLALPIPTVFLGAPLLPPGYDKTPYYVDTDNYGGARLAAERMVEMGVRRPATVAGPRDMAAALDRLHGWCETLEQAGLEVAVAHGDYTRASGARAAAQLLDADPTIDGIFAASDLMAQGVLDTLRERGIRIGDEVKVIGFDDFEAASQTVPPLTTVVNPAVELGRQATVMVLNLVKGRETPSPVMLPVELHIRASG